MAKKIGRNDPCPCGSGKKYKVCCLRKIRKLSIATWPNFHWTCFPEEFVICELLRSSKEFLVFYQAERRKIVKPIFWVQESSLPRGIDYRTTRLETGELFIRLKRVPAIIEDAVSIAHELQHFILDTENFPLVGFENPQFETISSALSSMVHDPLVDSRLKIYGFDLWKKYQKEVRDTIRQFRGGKIYPKDDLARKIWIFNYVSKILDWELVCNMSRGSDNEYQLLFNNLYPDIAKEGQKLLKLVNNIGYDTPEKQTALFKEIIQIYNLETILKIGWPFQM